MINVDEAKRDYLIKVLESGQNWIVNYIIDNSLTPEAYYLAKIAACIPGVYAAKADVIVDLYLSRRLGWSSADMIEKGWWGDGVVDFISQCITAGHIMRSSERTADQAERYAQFGGEVDEWGLYLSS